MNWEDVDFWLEPDSHRYEFRGSEVPACTRALELARPSLAGVPRDTLEIARVRGQSCHKAVELHAKDDLDRRYLKRAIRERFHSWEIFLEEWKVEPLPVPEKFWIPQMTHPILVEVPLVHPVFMYGVTPDLGLCLVNGAVSTVEAKATSSHNDATALQTASQVAAIDYFFSKFAKVERRFAVRMVPNERPDVLCYKDPSDWGMFTSFLNVNRWRAKRGLDKAA